MIDSPFIVFAGVVLVHLAGVSLVALAVMVLACTVLAAAITVGIIKGLTRGAARVLERVRRRKPRRAGPVVPLSMEEALAQVATGKTSTIQSRPAQRPGAAANPKPGGGNGSKKHRPFPVWPLPAAPGRTSSAHDQRAKANTLNPHPR